MVGARTFETAFFPATSGTTSRHVRFAATLQNTSGASQVNVQLYDVTHSVVITGTTLNNSAAPSLQLPFDVNSGDLVVGTSSGNIRTDDVPEYEVQISMVGGGSSDEAICTSAKLIVFYA